MPALRSARPGERGAAIAQHGLDAPLPGLLQKLATGCPHLASITPYHRCEAWFPGLGDQLAGGQLQRRGDDAGQVCRTMVSGALTLSPDFR